MNHQIDQYRNRIICGDCLEIMKELPDNSVDLVLTDPPYNVGIKYANSDDNLSEERYDKFIETITGEMRRISNNKIVMVVGSKMLRQWWNHVPDAKLVIVKMGATSNNKIKGLSLQFHPLLITAESSVYDRDLWEDIRWPGEGYYFNEPRYGHPAMTPLRLMKRCVEYFSHKPGPVFEPFLGSGTAAVACKELDRDYIGIEIAPEYCAIAEKRVNAVHPKLGLEL